MSGYPTPAGTALHTWHIREERDALLDRALYLGGIVEAVCVELGIHHDTTPAEVVAAIQALRGGDALATLEHTRRQRDSLARRCAVRFEEAEQLRARIAELEQGQREPRVWLPGDTVPADVWTRGPDGEVSSHDLDEVIDPDWAEGAYVEVVHVPDDDAYTAAVAAARARRAATDGEVTA